MQTVVWKVSIQALSAIAVSQDHRMLLWSFCFGRSFVFGESACRFLLRLFRSF